MTAMAPAEKPRLDAAARAIIEDALAKGVDVVVRKNAEGKVMVEIMTRKIIYRTP